MGWIASVASAFGWSLAMVDEMSPEAVRKRSGGLEALSRTSPAAGRTSIAWKNEDVDD